MTNGAMKNHMLNKKPKISVIIPTYNRASTIARSIDSVLNQTFKDYEVIVVDDASIDNTEELVKIHYPEIRYIKCQKNKGVASARNTGIKIARGEYIAFQDSDDEWYPNKLEEIMKILDFNKDIDFITSYGKIIGYDNKIIGNVGRAPWINRSSKRSIILKLFIANFVATQGVVVKKEKLIDAGGFDESFPSVNDYELWVRLIPICNIYFVDKPLFNIYFSKESITFNIKKRLKFQIQLFNKNKNILKRYSKNVFLYYVIRQKYLSNMLCTAAWDLGKRKKDFKLSFLLYFLSFLVFPNPGFYYFIKNILGERK